MAKTQTTTSDETFGLHNLSPAEGSHRMRKRVGRGPGSGTGKTSGRGQKGQKARSGSHFMRAGFIGGQMPLQMQQGKIRGPHKKTSMPMGPFRTQTQGINVRDLERRFEAGAEVTPETLLASGLLRHLRHPVKILGEGELTIALTVTAHGFSASARQKIEAAGGSARLLGEPSEDAAPAAAVEPPAADADAE
jgi:large subunit ribosomal protein L15